jgi:hypothetical protein
LAERRDLKRLANAGRIGGNLHMPGILRAAGRAAPMAEVTCKDRRLSGLDSALALAAGRADVSAARERLKVLHGVSAWATRPPGARGATRRPHGTDGLACRRPVRARLGFGILRVWRSQPVSTSAVTAEAPATIFGYRRV